MSGNFNTEHPRSMNLIHETFGKPFKYLFMIFLERGFNKQSMSKSNQNVFLHLKHKLDNINITWRCNNFATENLSYKK